MTALKQTSSTVWRAITFLLLLALLWRLRQPVMLIFGAVLVAATLCALAAPLTRHTRLSQRASLAVVLGALLALLATALWLVGDPLAEQLHDLRSQLPNAWRSVRGWLEGLPFGQRLLALAGDLHSGNLPWADIASLASRAMQGGNAADLPDGLVPGDRCPSLPPRADPPVSRSTPSSCG
jgi:predicted PurR-regulated permease PerM